MHTQTCTIQNSIPPIEASEIKPVLFLLRYVKSEFWLHALCFLVNGGFVR